MPLVQTVSWPPFTLVKSFTFQQSAYGC